jgi:hypothetical protein
MSGRVSLVALVQGGHAVVVGQGAKLLGHILGEAALAQALRQTSRGATILLYAPATLEAYS